MTGSWRITRKEQRSWSVPYKVWLPWATYIFQGYAFHEYPDVPPQAASHRCVRVPAWDSEWLYGQIPLGTLVTVRGAPAEIARRSSRGGRAPRRPGYRGRPATADQTPDELFVGFAMPSAGFQVGAVRGRDVVLAKGFEIDLARELGKRLAIPRVRFVNEALFSTLLVAGRKDWDLAIAQISVTPARAQRVDFSSPYLSADQACSSASD